ncbi:hypothetical protein P8452_10636 [Trifolium repens]|nr:hypothetical protein P8452_10636 [Trifolium repens]
MPLTFLEYKNTSTYVGSMIFGPQTFREREREFGLTHKKEDQETHCAKIAIAPPASTSYSFLHLLTTHFCDCEKIRGK